MERQSVKPEIKQSEQCSFDSNKEAKAKRESEGNRSTNVSERHHHHYHHHSKHRRSKKIRRFFKKNRNLFINIASLLCAVIAIATVSLVKDTGDYASIGHGTNQNTNQGTVNDAKGTLQIEFPFFSETVPLIKANAISFLERDLSVPLKDVIERYRAVEKRLDVGLPVTLFFTIDNIPKGYTVTSSTVEVSENTAFTDSYVYTLKSNERSVKVYFLKVNTQYFYRINVAFSDDSTTSIQGEFRTADTVRFLDLQGAVNVRDIGNWKTTSGKTIRQGLLYRGSELDGAVEANYKLTSKGVSDMLTVLGICTDMDLRSSSDNAYEVNVLGENVEHIYYDSPQYVGVFTESGKETIRKIFRDLANPSRYPVYLHCTYGLDRTGTVCYILEALLGVDEESLLRDYELSALYHGFVSSDSMMEFVAAFDVYEGQTLQEKVENYLLSAGVTEEEIVSIRDIFLED